MNNYTPGPWTAVHATVAAQIDVMEIADIAYMRVIPASGGWPTARTPENDARLIAAAPELLEALTRMAGIIDNMGDMPDGFIHPSPWKTLKCEEALMQARAAIAKATGGDNA